MKQQLEDMYPIDTSYLQYKYLELRYCGKKDNLSVLLFKECGI